MKLKNCLPRIDPLLIGLALSVMLVGTALTLTWVGAIIGVPMFIAGIELLSEPRTVRDKSCV